MSRESIAKGDIVAGWSEEEIGRLELGFLHKALRCDEPRSVDVAVAFAGFMSHEKLDADNYPHFPVSSLRISTGSTKRQRHSSRPPTRCFPRICSRPFEPRRRFSKPSLRALRSARLPSPDSRLV